MSPFPARDTRGFTLLEMLVALAVFAVLGVMSTQMVRRIIDVHDVAVTRGERLSDVQRAIEMIERDVLQSAARPVRDGFGDPLPVLRVGGESLLELTRNGYRNPLGQKRADLQRVTYVLLDGALQRQVWPVLDRAEDTIPLVQTLLENVESAEFVVIDVSGNEHSYWPLIGGDGSDPNLRIAGIELRATFPPMGEIVRVWDMPQPFGNAQPPAPPAGEQS